MKVQTKHNSTNLSIVTDTST